MLIQNELTLRKHVIFFYKLLYFRQWHWSADSLVASKSNLRNRLMEHLLSAYNEDSESDGTPSHKDIVDSFDLHPVCPELQDSVSPDKDKDSGEGAMDQNDKEHQDDEGYEDDRDEDYEDEKTDDVEEFSDLGRFVNFTFCPPGILACLMR